MTRMMHGTSGSALQRLLSYAAVLGFGLLMAGCQYRCGSLMHPQIASIAVGTVVNETDDPSLSSVLRGSLSERFMSDGTVRLLSRSSADAVVESEIVKYRTRKLARAERRDEDVRDRDSDAYQTVIYRAEVVVKYRVRVPGYSNPLLKDAEVVGTADFSRFPDITVPRQAALRQAVDDAAIQIAAGVTEAW